MFRCFAFWLVVVSVELGIFGFWNLGVVDLVWDFVSWLLSGLVGVLLVVWWSRVSGFGFDG